jgi:hypothetical protein
LEAAVDTTGSLAAALVNAADQLDAAAFGENHR